MGSLFGSTQNLNQNVSPTVGTGTQQMFNNALFNYGLTPTGGMQNGVPGSALAGMPGYTGQLTPDLGAAQMNGSQNVSQAAWNSWNPQTSGLSGLQQNAQQANQLFSGNTSSGPLSFLSQYLGGQQVANPLGPPGGQLRQGNPSPYNSMMRGGSGGWI